MEHWVPSAICINTDFHNKYNLMMARSCGVCVTNLRKWINRTDADFYIIRHGHFLRFQQQDLCDRAQNLGKILEVWAALCWECLRGKVYQQDLNPALNSLKQLEGIFLWISVITNRLAVVKGLMHSESSYLNPNHQGMSFLTRKMEFNSCVVLYKDGWCGKRAANCIPAVLMESHFLKKTELRCEKASCLFKLLNSSVPYIDLRFNFFKNKI